MKDMYYKTIVWTKEILKFDDLAEPPDLLQSGILCE